MMRGGGGGEEDRLATSNDLQNIPRPVKGAFRENSNNSLSSKPPMQQYCTKCNVKCRLMSRFCPECGMKLPNIWKNSKMRLPALQDFPLPTNQVHPVKKKNVVELKKLKWNQHVVPVRSLSKHKPLKKSTPISEQVLVAQSPTKTTTASPVPAEIAASFSDLQRLKLRQWSEKMKKILAVALDYHAVAEQKIVIPPSRRATLASDIDDLETQLTSFSSTLSKENSDRCHRLLQKIQNIQKSFPPIVVKHPVIRSPEKSIIKRVLKSSPKKSPEPEQVKVATPRKRRKPTWHTRPKQLYSTILSLSIHKSVIVQIAEGKEANSVDLFVYDPFSSSVSLIKLNSIVVSTLLPNCHWYAHDEVLPDHVTIRNYWKKTFTPLLHRLYIDDKGVKLGRKISGQRGTVSLTVNGLRTFRLLVTYLISTEGESVELQAMDALSDVCFRITSSADINLSAPLNPQLLSKLCMAHTTLGFELLWKGQSPRGTEVELPETLELKKQYDALVTEEFQKNYVESVIDNATKRIKCGNLSVKDYSIQFTQRTISQAILNASQQK